MKQSGTLIQMAVWLSITTAALPNAILAGAACNAPRYRLGRVWVDAASTVDLNISIQLGDFAPDRLICLAKTLKAHYPARDMSVFIFSSQEAALGYVPPVERTPKLVEYESKLHGLYFYSRAKHEEYLLILPDGHSQNVNSPLTTRIDLPIERVPVCRLEAKGRCLLEFQHIDYPASIEGRKGVTGRVTLAGRIDRNGVMSGVSVVGAQISPVELRTLLVTAASRNLGTWRFAPSGRTDEVRITYEFDRVDSPLVEGGKSLHFRMPYGVTAEDRAR
jgi:hypothetical protein